jgi:PPK2 family polyphosphate:nucleotide phosphotransferase
MAKNGGNQPVIPPMGKKVRLRDYDPGYTEGFTDQTQVAEQLQKDLERMSELQDILYAGGQKALLIIIQAIDTGGKDGTIKHVFRGLNPAGVQVTSFKSPTPEELGHDFLWRIHQHTPRKGMIAVFNRSHYEDVLVVRVHSLVEKRIWKERYAHINDFEELLHEHNTTVLKFFLYISKQEQKERLESRLREPNKHWKFNPDDLKERALWDEYIEAYENMLTKCNTDHAPWHIIPANKKWYRNYIVSRTIVQAMEGMKLSYPPAPPGLDQITIPD